MHKETHAEMFIRLLTEAFEEDRSMRRAILESQKRARVERFKQLRQSSLNRIMDTAEPLDCVQLMSEKHQQMRNA